MEVGAVVVAAYNKIDRLDRGQAKRIRDADQFVISDIVCGRGNRITSTTRSCRTQDAPRESVIDHLRPRLVVA